MDHVHQLLTSDLVASLLNIHPNDIGSDPDFQPPSSWLSWWNWAKGGISEGGSQNRWNQLSDCFNTEDGKHDHDNVPQELCNLIQDIQRLQIPRQPINIDGHFPRNVIRDDRGMSPKKIHEVFRMVAYIANLLDELKIDRRRVRIVDIGAGQGYLTRTLKSYLQTTHILALDSDRWQTRGSQVWEERVTRAARLSGNDSPSTPIAYKTIHITPSTLIPTINDWVSETTCEANDEDPGPDPVLFVALHACGSLTPDILRTCMSSARQNHPGWKAIGAVIVGCCYNLIRPSDFPLSAALDALATSSTSKLSLFHLPPSVYNLATQIPSQWLMSPKAAASVSLSIRKVVWRALLGRELLRVSAFGEVTRTLLEFENNYPGATLQTQYTMAPSSRQRVNSESSPPGTVIGSERGIGIGTSPTMRLLGRLPGSSYAKWSTFLQTAGQKLNVDLSASADYEQYVPLVRQLEVHHVLRCLIGPLVESLIILDRVQWLKEHLVIDDPEGPVVADGFRDATSNDTAGRQRNAPRVEAINLFDQATGSGRNVAIVVVPAPVSLT
ncbi:hypothetical protein AX17_005225 [Amanita inopinata Kibby_2008]|nr:hypothetical protein AX17_005225 [Amanita inopinata Kibby_2008]